MEDRLDSVIGSITAAIVGIIMTCMVLIPIGMDMIGSLGEAGLQFKPLLTAVIIMAIVGLVIGTIRYYQNQKR